MVLRSRLSNLRSWCGRAQGTGNSPMLRRVAVVEYRTIPSLQRGSWHSKASCADCLMHDSAEWRASVERMVMRLFAWRLDPRPARRHRSQASTRPRRVLSYATPAEALNDYL